MLPQHKGFPAPRRARCGDAMKTLVLRFGVNVLGSWGFGAGQRGLAQALKQPFLFALLLGLALLLGCGGGGTIPTPPSVTAPTPSVTVSVFPATASVDQGSKIQFSATVTGSSNQAVTWNIQEGPPAGSIDQTGLYKAPTGVLAAHVVAISVADPSKSSSAVVTTNAVSVSVLKTAAVPRGRQRQFSAFVGGTVIKDVIWTIDEGTAGGAISSDGVYTAPLSGGLFHVTARSVTDPSKAATTAVSVTDAGFRMLRSSTLEPRVSHTATLLPNGKVLIAGGGPCEWDDFWGEICGGSPLSSAELFDPATETFSATGSMSIGRSDHTATLLKNGTVLITGGVNSGNRSDATAEIYDPATGGFTRVGDMSDALGRFGHTASLLGDGRVLIAGGLQGEGSGFNGSTQTAELYDPATQTFSPAGNMPKEAAFHTASVLLDGRALIIGGTANTCPVNQHVVTFDPASNSFSTGVSLPKDRAGHTATILNDGRVLITGGADPCDVSGTRLDTAVVFDPSTTTFSPEMIMSERRSGHSATLLADGKVLIVGETAELFDPATFTFAITGDPNVLWVRRATRLADGRVLLTGFFEVAEIYE